MATLRLLIGIAGCGKSTYAEKHFIDAKIISSDSIREEVFGDINDQSHNGEVFNIVIKRAREALNSGIDTVIDATNLRRKYRKGILEQMPKSCRKEAIVFAIPFEKCLIQNEQRERHVPEHVMWKMYKSFEPPHVTEGFDKIDIVDVDDPAYDLSNGDHWFKIYEELEELKKIPQNNPHHDLTIGEHCLKTYEEMKILLEKNVGKFSEYDERILKYAALLHDIGKKETKVFTDMKGRTTEIAHFYFHQNVGAYKSLILLKDMTTDFRIEVANIIALHMTFYAGEHVIGKRQGIYSENFWSKVVMVHEADLRGHLKAKGIPV